MTPSQVLPIPAGLRKRACDTVSSRVGRLPFVCKGVTITCDMITAAMEALNAQATRTLCLVQKNGAGGHVRWDGLDRLLLERGFLHPDSARVLSLVLERAGISGPAAVADRQSRQMIRGTRLDSGWAWDIASSHRKTETVQGTAPPSEDVSSSWQNLCPVCRTGTLNAVLGQKLFGIPPTGFLLCNSCGAKFVPDERNFRLVAIARKKDPLWGRYLNRTMSPEEWEAIGRETKPSKTPRPTHTKGEGLSGPSSNRKRNHKNNSGRLAVPAGTGMLYFTMLALQFRQGNIQDLFSKNDIPVSAIIRLPEYRHLSRTVQDNYAHYLDVPVGFFLSELKGKKELFYREFLHAFGDETFCSFRTTAGGIAAKRGVFCVAVNGEIRAAGSCCTAFSAKVNDELGWLSPQACYRDGDPERCRINALLCSHRKDGGIFVFPVEDDDEIARIVRDLEIQACTTKRL